MPLDEEEFINYDPFDPERQQYPGFYPPTPVRRNISLYTPLDQLDPFINYYNRVQPSISSRQFYNLGESPDGRGQYEWYYYKSDENTLLNAEQILNIRYANGTTNDRPSPSVDAPPLVFDAGEKYRDISRFSPSTPESFNMLETIGALSDTPEQILESLPNLIRNRVLQSFIPEDQRNTSLMFKNSVETLAFLTHVRKSGLIGAGTFAFDPDDLRGLLSPTNQRVVKPKPPGPDEITYKPARLEHLISEFIRAFPVSPSQNQNLIDSVFITALNNFILAANIDYKLEFIHDYQYHNFKIEAPFMVDFASFWAINGISDRAIFEDSRFAQFTE